MTKDIYAVIWQDMGILLSLPTESATLAVEKARSIHAQATARGVILHRVRAVHVNESDKLTTLWEA